MVERHGYDIVSARISRSNEGGPVRRILNGRRRGRTGGFVAFKAGFRAMPWESFEGELPMLQASEVSSGVSALLAQPHRLEMIPREMRRRLVYFPDLELTVDRLFISQLRDGLPFAEVAAAPRPRIFHQSSDQQLIIEIKVAGDPRVKDEFYLEKLRLARQVYARVGAYFLVVERERDLPTEMLNRFKTFLDKRYTEITPLDVDMLRKLFAGGGGHRRFGEVSKVLGGGVLGPAKISALQVRRIISIDLRYPVDDNSVVFLVGAA